MHKFVPADDGSIFRNPFDLSALSQHIAGTDRAGKSILYGSNDDIYDAGICTDAFKFVVELIQCNSGDGFGFVQIEFDFLLGGERVNHVGDSAYQIHCIEHVDGLWAVRHGDGDFVVFTDTDGFQCFCTAFNFVYHLPIGSGPAHKVECDVIRVLRRDLHDFIDHRTLIIIQMHGHFAHGGFPRCFRGDFFHKPVCSPCFFLIYNRNCSGHSEGYRAFPDAQRYALPASCCGQNRSRRQCARPAWRRCPPHRGFALCRQA